MRYIPERLPAARHADFRALWIGGFCSNVSLWTLLLGNAWIVYELSDSSFWVGVSTFASMSPFLLAPFGGVVADRVERRLLVQATRIGAFVTTAALCSLALADVLEVWTVIVFAFLQGMVRAVELPADQALLANVVPARDLPNAVALTSMTQHGSRAVGPVLAGPLLATVGVAGAYGLAALFAVLAFATVRQVKTSSFGGVADLRQVFHNLGGGLGYVAGSGPVLAIFLLVVAHCALTMSFDAMLPGFAETELDSHSTGFTIMTLGIGVGALAGTFVLAVTSGRSRGPLLLVTALASGLAPALMSMSMGVPTAAVSATLMGSSQAMFMALSAVFLQELVPDGVRGRVMSLYLMSAGGIMALANLAFASLADALGAPLLFLIPGLAFVGIVVATSLSGPYLPSLYRKGRLSPSRAAP